MPKLKNISGGQLDTPFLNQMVKDGEVVDAPDFQADGESPLIWPANRWEPVTDDTKTPPAGKAAK